MIAKPLPVGWLCPRCGRVNAPAIALCCCQGLSERQREVLAARADGWQEKQIAKQLGISRMTVKNHLAEIRDKLDARDTCHAVAIAMRRGELI